MKNIGLTLLLLTMSLSAFSQTNFTPGYYISVNNERLPCELKNHGNEDIGEDYIIRTSKEEKGEQISIEEVTEFGIDGSYCFVRSHIEIDISPNTITFIKDTLNHEQIQAGHVFLKQIIGSEVASLYSFRYEGGEYFFYQLGDSDIKLLVYKKYVIGNSTLIEPKILENNTFKNQLAIDLPIQSGTPPVSYNKKNLAKYFNKYISEHNTESYAFSPVKKGDFNFILSTSFSTSSFFTNLDAIRGEHFDNSTNFGYGIEMQYIMGENRSKWGVFAETTYNEVSFHKDGGTLLQFGIDYQYLEIPIGVLYNLNFSEKLKIQLKAAIVQNVALDASQIYYYKPTNSYEVKPKTITMVSAGISYGIFDASARVYSRNNLTQHLYNKDSRFDKYSIRLGIKLF